MNKLRIYFMALATLMLAACTIHQPDIQQGNVLDPENVDKLTVGMDKSQVRFLMGTPLIQDVFHENRWDYVYFYEIVAEGSQELGRVTVLFENNKVANIIKIPTEIAKADN